MGLEKIRKDWFMSKPSQSTTEVTTAKNTVLNIFGLLQMKKKERFRIPRKQNPSVVNSFFKLFCVFANKQQKVMTYNLPALSSFIKF